LVQAIQQHKTGEDMAIIKKNPWISGASGMAMDSIVYRQMGGKTVVSGKPSKSTNPPTQKQLDYRAHFRKASAYGKMAMNSPLLKEIYGAAADIMNSAYTMALKDYLQAPVVEQFLLKEFGGNAGDPVGLYAYDNFGIVSVTMTIADEHGAVLERGEFTELVKNGFYEYRLTSDLPAGIPCHLMAEARDLAGNVTVLQETVIPE
jgi:hypothetical protein